MHQLFISNKKIGGDEPVFVIAEAGVNHNGSLDLALKLVDAAAEAGADAVKFQTFRAEQVVTVAGKMAGYQKRNLGVGESQLEMLRKLEFREEWYPAVMRRACEKNIIFLSTPHGGFASADLLQGLGVPAFKFGSGDLTNLPLLKYAARFKKPMLVSTGMAMLAETQEAIRAIKKTGNNKIIVFHCTTEYPCPPSEVNLRVLGTFQEKLGVLVGYSDHTDGPQASLMAATLGACAIEKHFTLDRNMPGPDQKASMEPVLFKAMVEQLKLVSAMLGADIKKPTALEKKYISLVRKSLVSARDIKKGEKFTRDNLAIKRPGTGIPPKDFGRVLGKVANVDISSDSLIGKKMIK